MEEPIPSIKLSPDKYSNLPFLSIKSKPSNPSYCWYSSTNSLAKSIENWLELNESPLNYEFKLKFFPEGYQLDLL